MILAGRLVFIDDRNAGRHSLATYFTTCVTRVMGFPLLIQTSLVWVGINTMTVSSTAAYQLHLQPPDTGIHCFTFWRWWNDKKCKWVPLLMAVPVNFCTGTIT